MTEKKWFENLTASEIVKEMSRISHNCVACAIQGEKGISEDLHKLFIMMFNEVIPAIVEIKSEYYLHNETVFHEWGKCQYDLHAIKNTMENELYQIYCK